MDEHGQDQDPWPVEAALDEAGLRLPGFREHARVVMADDQEWSLPLPTPREYLLFVDRVQAGAHEAYNRRMGEVDEMPEGFARTMEGLYAGQRFSMAVGTVLLRLNYRLTDVDTCRVLFVNFDPARMASIHGAICRVLDEVTRDLVPPVGWYSNDSVLFEN